jgi:hypothetical protein
MTKYTPDPRETRERQAAGSFAVPARDPAREQNRTTGRAGLVLAAIRLAPLIVGLVALILYGVLAVRFSAQRADYYYLADAFLHGRAWIDPAVLPSGIELPLNDTILVDGRLYLPFQPMPAVMIAPIVALLGLDGAIRVEPIVNATLAASVVAFGWVLIGRMGVKRLRDRILLVELLGFGTVMLNVTVHGGVWHTAQLAATAFAMWGLAESHAQRPRAWLLGILAGAALLSRSTLLFVVPYFAWRAAGAPTNLPALRVALRRGARPVTVLAAAFAPFAVAMLVYDMVRFGSPFETGYGLAQLPPFLEQLRAQGLFSLVHVPMNLDLMLLRPPIWVGPPDFVHPDLHGMSTLLASPALFAGLRTLPRRVDARALGLAGLLVLTPTLLYYGGGWVQFGYRYLLDSMPFWIALCGIQAARSGIGWVWQVAIAWSVVVNGWLVLTMSSQVV